MSGGLAVQDHGLPVGRDTCPEVFLPYIFARQVIEGEHSGRRLLPLRRKGILCGLAGGPQLAAGDDQRAAAKKEQYDKLFWQSSIL